MLEYILMTQLFFTDGTYELRNYKMVVQNDGKECSELTKSQAIELSVYFSGRQKSEVAQTRAMCTDKNVVLDFWPVPEEIPVPESRPDRKEIIL